jgi:hypothetical protein
MSDGRVKVRPITIMALLAVVALVAAGLYAWLGPAGTNGSPAALPIALGTSKAAGTSGAADIAIAPARPTVFVAAADLPALMGSAHAWRLVGTAPDQARVARLGQALGLQGTPQSRSDGWTMGTADGPQLVVSAAGTHAWSWMYNPSATVSSPPIACARPLGIGADPGVTTETVSPNPCRTSEPSPVGVPDPAAAERRARAVLDAAGFDLAGWKVTSTADPYSATVTASPVLDGTDVEGLSMSVTFGAHAVINYASGWFGAPQRADSYPLVGTKAAIDDLQKGDASGIVPMTGAAVVPETATANTSTWNRAAPASRLGATTTSSSGPTGPTGAAGSTGSTGPGDSTGSAPVDRGAPVPTTPATVSPTTTPQAPVTVTIDHADLVLSAQVGTDGSMWLVPAYRLSAVSGGTWTVLAVDRKYVATAPVERAPIATIEPYGSGQVSTGSGGSGTGVATPATATAAPNGG